MHGSVLCKNQYNNCEAGFCFCGKSVMSVISSLTILHDAKLPGTLLHDFASSKVLLFQVNY